MIGIKKWIAKTFPDVFPPNTYKYYKFLYGKTENENSIFSAYKYKYYSMKHTYYDYIDTSERPNFICSEYAAWVQPDGKIGRLDGPAIVHSRPTIWTNEYLVNGKIRTMEVFNFAKQNGLDLTQMGETDKMLLKLFLTQFL